MPPKSATIKCTGDATGVCRLIMKLQPIRVECARSFGCILRTYVFQDLLRRMLKLDPNERASIPEIFNHGWLRFRNVTSLDNQVCKQRQYRELHNFNPLEISTSLSRVEGRPSPCTAHHPFFTPNVFLLFVGCGLV